MDAIEILEVDLDQSEMVLGEQKAIWCTFIAILGTGKALVTPGHRKPEQLKGFRYRVQPYYRKLGEVQVISTKDSQGYRLVSLEKAGSFEIEGQVSSIVWLDDEGAHSVVEVLVGGWTFTFSAMEIAADDLNYGQWVIFKVEGLNWLVMDDSPVDLERNSPPAESSTSS
jgi:hypothetical protein